MELPISIRPGGVWAPIPLFPEYREVLEAAIAAMVVEYDRKAVELVESAERCARFTAQIKAMR